MGFPEIRRIRTAVASFTPAGRPALLDESMPSSPAVMAGLDPRLSGLILWTERMTLILLLSGRFATIWTRKGINAM
ncbi:MAG: hypothetical protein ACLPX9_19370, partial [Rhodomicrobium sp.]